MSPQPRYRDRDIDFLGIECAWPDQAKLGPSRLRPPPKHWRWRHLALILALLLATAGIWQLGQAGYIHAKAWLAQVLIRDAWSRTLAGEQRVRPWPWADTWPVARLRAPGQDADLYVLAGADGRAIAFGPGHVFGTAAPGEAGNSVIGGHRDTHFAFLQRLAVGDLLEIETPGRRVVAYRVTGRDVVDRRDSGVMAAHDADTELTLVTCYPFDAVRAGGPMRYVVRARAEVVAHHASGTPSSTTPAPLAI
ncbi:MAG: class GN sortase [Rhodocyclaceae bacterium]|nr:class GN sortase [Rhodocyclaceae bacterium]